MLHILLQICINSCCKYQKGVCACVCVCVCVHMRMRKNLPNKYSGRQHLQLTSCSYTSLRVLYVKRESQVVPHVTSRHMGRSWREVWSASVTSYSLLPWLKAVVLV